MRISLALIGQRIVDQRKMKKFSQLSLADKVGVSDRTLRKVEAGHDMKLSVLLAIAEALDIDVVQLLSADNSSLSTLSESEKQQICSHLKAICELLPD
nr:helix-turn-helix transcriptional regulator [Shewanella sp.]